MEVSSRLYASYRTLLKENVIKKDAVNTSKVELEMHALKLQNLYYEKEYLLTEITRCTNFQTPELDKIQFQENTLNQGGIPNAHHHAKQLEALQNELMTRKQ